LFLCCVFCFVSMLCFNRNKAKTTTQKQSIKHNTETKQKTQHRNKAKNTT
jgi:hypothetical protein